MVQADYALHSLIICVLPITAVFIFSLTAPIDDTFANFGLWLHDKYNWSVATFVTELRFAKVGVMSNLFYGQEQVEQDLDAALLLLDLLIK